MKHLLTRETRRLLRTFDSENDARVALERAVEDAVAALSPPYSVEEARAAALSRMTEHLAACVLLAAYRRDLDAKRRDYLNSHCATW